MTEQERRIEAIVQLLQTLRDYDFQPLTWTGALQRQARRGEAPSARVECPDCEDGRVRIRGFTYRCANCKGRGWLRADPYTKRVLGSSDTDVVVERRAVICDACGGKEFGNGRPCERCNNTGRVTITHATMRPFRAGNLEIGVEALFVDPGDSVSSDPRLRAMERRAEVGSYDELVRALEALHEAWPSAYRMVWGLHVDPDGKWEPLRASSAHAAALQFLEARMPREIRVPPAALAYDRRVRQRKRRRDEVAA